MSFVIISFITFESDIAMNIIKTKVIFFCFYHTQQEYDNNVHISFKSNPEQTYFAAVFSLAIHFIIPSHCSDSYTPNSTNRSVFICWNLMLIQVSISIGIFLFLYGTSVYLHSLRNDFTAAKSGYSKYSNKIGKPDLFGCSEEILTLYSSVKTQSYYTIHFN